MAKPPTPTQRRVMEAMRDGARLLCHGGGEWHLWQAGKMGTRVNVRTIAVMLREGWLSGTTLTPKGLDALKRSRTVSKHKIIPVFEGRPDTRASWQPMGLPDEESRQMGERIHLRRCPPGNFAEVSLVIKGREYLYHIQPCPSRRWLVRMARKLLKAAIAGESP